MPNVLSPRDLVFRPDNMDETVPHTDEGTINIVITSIILFYCLFKDQRGCVTTHLKVGSKTN